MSASSEAIPVETLRWHGRRLELIDQRALPARLEYVSCTSAAEVAEAIRSMVVRGAPAIGCAAAFGVALEAKRQQLQRVRFRMKSFSRLKTRHNNRWQKIRGDRFASSPVNRKRVQECPLDVER